MQDFSIYFPFITEEIFQELYHNNTSIHITEIKPLQYNFEKEILLGNQIVEIISEARGAKTEANVSLKTPIKVLSLGLDKSLEDAIQKSIKDFKATLFIEKLEIKQIPENYEVYNVELNIETEQ